MNKIIRFIIIIVILMVLSSVLNTNSVLIGGLMAMVLTTIKE